MVVTKKEGTSSKKTKFQEKSYNEQASESTTTTKRASPSLEATMEAEKTMELFKNSSSEGGDERVEHGIFPSTMEAIYDTSDGEASDDAHLMAFMLGDVMPSYGGEMGEDGKHGIFHSPMEAHGVEIIEPTPICMSDDLVPIPCEHESHLAHLSVSESELSDSTSCEFECFIFEGMSDTPSELRVVVDRSSEAISISNNLPSTSSVFSHDVLGTMEPQMEMYMVDEDDAIPHD